MKAYLEAEKQDLRRKRRERYIIACLVVLIPVITYLGIKVLDLGLDLPIHNSILFSSSLISTSFSSPADLFDHEELQTRLQEEKKIMGAKLRTSWSWPSSPCPPATIILFFVPSSSFQLPLSTGSIPVERSLKSSQKSDKVFTADGR
jgi:hypothetical protein